MRRFHLTVTPGVIHRQAAESLERILDWQPFGRTIAVSQLLDLLLLMAASGSSLFATVSRFFSFSHETASQAVHANLRVTSLGLAPAMDRLTQGLVRGLHDVIVFTRQDRRRRWLVAIDTHYVPYYGQRGPYVLGGPKKQGTKWFFGYATAVLLHKHRRYTVGLIALEDKAKPHDIVRTLLDQIAEKGLNIEGVVLDSAFDSGDTLLLLQERRIAYTVPLRRKGNTRNARNRLFEGRHRLIRWAEWVTDKTRRPVRTRTLLWKGQPRTMVFAFQGWNSERARNVHQEAGRQRRLYQRRFGIETSYRQKNQAHSFTTSRNPAYRLLLEGLGYLLRQLWALLTEQLARNGHATQEGWVATLPMKRLIDWLVGRLARLYPETLEISGSPTGCG
jgi:DDE family transposase